MPSVLKTRLKNMWWIGPSFFYRNWDWALAQAELEFHFLANRLGENDVRFSSENSELVVDSRKTIDDNCQDLVTEKFSREYFGCTSQESWHGNTLSPYLKPLSTTILQRIGRWDRFLVLSNMNCLIKQ